MNAAPATDSSFLVEPAALAALDRDTVLVDTRPPAAYQAGHLPGAISLSTYDLFVPGTRADELARFRSAVAGLYAAAGIASDQPVVVYEDGTGMRAARELWVLQYLGHRAARMLHGGLRGWTAEGGVPQTGPVARPAARFAIDERPDMVIGCDEITARGPGAHCLLDVRDADEFNGRDRTACCSRRGRLPGARWLEWTELLDPASGRLLAPELIRARAARAGLASGTLAVPYCHRGARSAHTYYALRHAGHAMARNYIGSWHEWSARTDLALEA